MTTTAVIVTFNPVAGEFARTIDCIAPQAGQTIVVDNGSSQAAKLEKIVRAAGAEFLALGDNYGIARAQNEGIRHARAAGSDHVILFDQDSRPAPGMIATLELACQSKRADGIAVGSVGPRYVDERQKNPEPFIEVRRYRLERKRCLADHCIVEVDYLISSGCLIPMATLDAVGLMREDLFIDYVDIEWGLRAQQKGFQSYGVCAARMHHELGGKPVRFGKRMIPTHSPLRYYYHFRNAIWLYKQSWLRIDWKVVDAVRLMRKFVFYGLVTRPRLQNTKMMTLGLLHGLVGHMGRLDNGR